MDRKPTRMSKHGYPIYEQPWNPKIHDCIFQQGLETALKKYSKEEIEHHLGGKAYGAEIGPDYVILATRFNNNGRTWEEVKPILDLFERNRYIELLGATLTAHTLVLQLKISQLHLSDVMTKSVITTADRRFKGHMNVVKDLSFNKAVEMKPQNPTNIELKRWGLSDTEITKREQNIAKMGFTADDLIYEQFKVRLIYRELARIGVNLV